MLKIRLQRVGRKNIRTFRIVLTDSKNSAKSGKIHEILGMYDPVNNKKEIDGDRAKYWMSKGAKVSDTMHNFLIDKKVIPGKKVNALPRKSPIKPEAKEGEKTEAKAEAPKAVEPTPAPTA
ncbi:MAG TPA: 30S ribosomal protein S16 [Candidatus Paceibacterota bacterium]|nr:30S ribosomal protein S16 [Candidatus Paceibacterota bacterium]